MKKQDNITTLNDIKNNIDATTPVVDQNSTQMVENMMAQLNAEHRESQTAPANTTTTTTTTTQTSMYSNNNNNNGSNDTQSEIPDITNAQEIARIKYEYLQKKKEFARNQALRSRRNNNAQDSTDVPSAVSNPSNPTLPNSGETSGDRLRAASTATREYAEGVTEVAHEQVRVADEISQINQTINTLANASRRLGTQYLNFMWTDPFVGIMTTGAVLGITAMFFRSGAVGYVSRSLISYLNPINSNNAVVTTVSGGAAAQVSDVENVVQRLMREGWNRISMITHTGGGLYFIRILFRGVRRGR